MAKHFIGESIAEAIDWAQDKLTTTRPVAESVLFSMLADKKITEGLDGFVLLEDDDDNDDDMKVRKQKRLSRRTAHRPRMTFSSHRKVLSERREILRQKLRAMGYSDEAEEMHYGKRDGSTVPHVDDPDDHTKTGLPRMRMPVGWR